MATFTSNNTGPFDPSDNLPTEQQDAPRATVTISSIPFDDTLGQFESNTGPFDIWTDYIVNNRFEKDRHTYVSGVTSPTGFNGQSTAFFQLENPTLLWICDWTASRLNSEPVIPDPTPADDDWILLDDHFEPTNLLLGPDGITPLYRISGTYVYGHKNPSDRTITDIFYPRPPWMKDSFRRTVAEGDVAQGISDEAPGGGGNF